MLRCTCTCSPARTLARSPARALSTSPLAPPAPTLPSHSTRPRARTAALHAASPGGGGPAARLAGAGQARWVSDLQTFRTRHGTVKVNLKSKAAVGSAQSRGERPYQEDTFAVSSLAIPSSALRINVLDDRLGAGWVPEQLEGFEGEEPTEEGGERRRQVAYFAVFDGHGGAQTSKYLSTALPSLIEKARPSAIPQAVDDYRALGGYLRRYRGGVLERFRREAIEEEEKRVGGKEYVRGMGVDEMAVLAFLQADNHVLSAPPDQFGKSGSVGTVALLHSLDLPHSHPYYSSALLSLTLAHLGDTSAILASTASGRAYRLTQAHHPDSRTEMERLRTTGTGVITDSFGESRWGGTLANTRGVGDREFKPLGVIAEPEIVKRVFKGDDFAYLLLLTDGITDSLSDQEICDLVRLEVSKTRELNNNPKAVASPERAAKRVVGFAEDVGAEDNLTCLCIPLPGWPRLGGLDTTASRREYRLRQASTRMSRQKRM
ncbi:hypothetical protein JCM8097_003511 [Rhodosporidiobolus ruineniae]